VSLEIAVINLTVIYRGKMMKTKLMTIMVSASMAGSVIAGDVVLVKPFADDTFIEVSEEVKFPEGLSTSSLNGDIFVTTFNVPNADYNPTPVNYLMRYSSEGELLARTDFSGSTPLVGVKYNPQDNHVYMASVGDITGLGSKILRINANFTETTEVQALADIPFIGTPGDRTVWNIDGSTHQISFGSNIRVPNDIVFDSRGGLYVSDSFQGAVFHLPEAAKCFENCQLQTLIHDPLLSTAGFPSFGANGLAIDDGERNLYIANTGDDRILTMSLEEPSGLSVFAEGVNGADGLAFDEAGYLWVAANQADQLIALNAEGRVVAQLGSFRGLKSDGAPKGLLFPASLEIVGNDILVTNMAQVATPKIGDEPEEKVSKFTISKVRIPLMMRRPFIETFNFLP
jgi:DNA-binding beta-propeller fold protein YncE